MYFLVEDQLYGMFSAASIEGARQRFFDFDISFGCMNTDERFKEAIRGFQFFYFVFLTSLFRETDSASHGYEASFEKLQCTPSSVD